MILISDIFIKEQVKLIKYINLYFPIMGGQPVKSSAEWKEYRATV